MDTPQIPPVPTHRKVNPAYESIIPLELHTDMGVYRVRIWRTEDEPFAMSDPQDFAQVVQKFKNQLTAKTKEELVKQIALSIVSVGRVAAVEILVAETRRGIVFYPDWS